MAVISRPGKEGNATTYQGKVAAGYTNILAQEVDADIDAIYSAWNAGVDTVNIKPGSVTAACLAPGAVTGSALAPGSITNAALAANSVQSVNLVDGTIVGADIAADTLTDSLIANVAWTKLIAPFLNQVTLATRGRLDSGTTEMVDLFANDASDQAYDGTKPSWLLRIDYTNDVFQVFRSPPPGNVYALLFSVASNGTLKAGSVDRNALAVNASYGAIAAVNSPANFVLSTPNVWTTLVTLPTLNTRGGFVHLHANHCLSVFGPVGGAICGQRWTRDGVSVADWGFNVASSAALFVPMPGINYMDNPPAGAHVYAYQVMTGPGCTMETINNADGELQAVELG